MVKIWSDIPFKTLERWYYEKESVTENGNDVTT